MPPKQTQGNLAQPKYQSLFKWLVGIIILGIIILIQTWLQTKEIAQESHKLAQRMHWIAEDIIPPKLKKSTVLSSKAGDKFIERSDIKRQLDFAMSVDIDGYWIVYGPKGEGKSEIVDHNAINRSAVVKFIVSSAGTKEELIASLMTELTIEKSVKVNVLKLKDVMTKCKSLGFTPLIIYEIERDKVAHKDTLVAFKGLAKELSGYCRSILVLSEANTVLDFTEDKRRERFIFVGEMTRQEAEQLLIGQGAKFTKEEMAYIFDNIGTVPQTLVQLVERVYAEGMCLVEYVKIVLDDARQDLVEFPLKPILAALKRQPDGASPEYFKNSIFDWNSGSATVKLDLSSPKMVGFAMKRQNCIMYHMERNLYQLQTTAHKVALKNYTV